MSGEWLPPEQKPHRCDLPKVDTWNAPAAGSRWRCSCGATYVVEEISQHGESWKQFRRLL